MFTTAKITTLKDLYFGTGHSFKSFEPPLPSL